MSSWIGCFSNPVGYSRNLLCNDPRCWSDTTHQRRSAPSRRSRFRQGQNSMSNKSENEIRSIDDSDENQCS